MDYTVDIKAPLPDMRRNSLIERRIAINTIGKEAAKDEVKKERAKMKILEDQVAIIASITAPPDTTKVADSVLRVIINSNNTSDGKYINMDIWNRFST